MQAARALRERYFIDHPSGFLALSPRNRRFEIRGVPGFIAYREQGRHLVLFGGVHAPAGARTPLLDGFIGEADRRGRRVIAVQVREAQRELFRQRGFTVNELGSSYALRLAAYSFAGTKRMSLRNKIKRARALGVRILEIGRELPSDAATFAQLSAISREWLAKKGKKELDFMIGEMGGPGDPERRIFAAVDGSDRMIGFITYVPAFGERPGFLHDLTRRTADAPAGCMELCNATAMERLAADGALYLHFGFTPFVLAGRDGPGASRLVSWVLRLLGRYGSFIYPARRQAEYKRKWLPDIVDPELVAFRPLSLRAIFDLLILTRSI